MITSLFPKVDNQAEQDIKHIFNVINYRYIDALIQDTYIFIKNNNNSEQNIIYRLADYGRKKDDYWTHYSLLNQKALDAKIIDEIKTKLNIDIEEDKKFGNYTLKNQNNNQNNNITIYYKIHYLTLIYLLKENDFVKENDLYNRFINNEKYNQYIDYNDLLSVICEDNNNKYSYKALKNLINSKIDLSLNINIYYRGKTAFMHACSIKVCYLGKIVEKWRLNGSIEYDVISTTFKKNTIICVQFLELLCKIKNIDYNKKDKDGNTALLLSLIGGHQEIPLFLLGKKDVECETKNNNGTTPLIKAIRYGNYDCTFILLQKKYKDKDFINSVDDIKMSAFMYACSSYSYEYNNSSTKMNKVIGEMLKISNINILLQNISGQTALNLAITNRVHIVIIKLIINKDKNILNILDDKGNNLFDYIDTFIDAIKNEKDMDSTKKYYKDLLEYILTITPRPKFTNTTNNQKKNNNNHLYNVYIKKKDGLLTPNQFFTYEMTNNMRAAVIKNKALRNSRASTASTASMTTNRSSLEDSEFRRNIVTLLKNIKPREKKVYNKLTKIGALTNNKPRENRSSYK